MFKFEIEKNLELRLFEYNNAEELYYLIDKNREYLRTWLGWVDKTQNETDALNFIRFTMQSLANNQGIKAGIWYENKLVGLIDHHDVNKNSKSVNIGYWLDEDLQGKGIMTKATKAMVDYAFKIGMNKVEIRVASENKKSGSIPERLGFIKEGVIRSAEYLYDHHVDHIVYGLLKEEWILTTDRY